MTERLLTLADLGARWSPVDGEVLDPKQTRRIIARLGLPAIRLGHRTVRYRPEDVDDAERATQAQGRKG